MMIKNKTLIEINCIPDNVRSEHLKWLVKNCSEYIVTPNGHEHWLTDTFILTHWGTDTGYSRKYMGLAFPDNFESWSFHNDELAGEAFETHHELENY